MICRYRNMVYDEAGNHIGYEVKHNKETFYVAVSELTPL